MLETPERISGLVYAVGEMMSGTTTKDRFEL